MNTNLRVVRWENEAKVRENGLILINQINQGQTSEDRTPLSRGSVAALLTAQRKCGVFTLQTKKAVFLFFFFPSLSQI